jgi:hypothetical protein
MTIAVQNLATLGTGLVVPHYAWSPRIMLSGRSQTFAAACSLPHQTCRWNNATLHIVESLPLAGRAMTRGTSLLHSVRSQAASTLCERSCVYG